jgi:hypothetical protein
MHQRAGCAASNFRSESNPRTEMLERVGVRDLNWQVGYPPGQAPPELQQIRDAVQYYAHVSSPSSQNGRLSLSLMAPILSLGAAVVKDTVAAPYEGKVTTKENVRRRLPTTSARRQHEREVQGSHCTRAGERMAIKGVEKDKRWQQNVTECDAKTRRLALR